MMTKSKGQGQNNRYEYQNTTSLQLLYMCTMTTISMVGKYAFICHTHDVSRDLAETFIFVGERHVCQQRSEVHCRQVSI